MFFDGIYLARSQIDRILKLKLRFSKCTIIMGRDHGHPYILSTTVLSDMVTSCKHIVHVHVRIILCTCKSMISYTWYDSVFEASQVIYDLGLFSHLESIQIFPARLQSMCALVLLWHVC